MFALILAGLKVVTGLFGKIFGDRGKRDDQSHAQTMARDTAKYKSQTIQANINLADAKSGNLYQAGWRPSVAWVCVLTLAMASVGQVFLPLVLAYLPAFGYSGDTSVLLASINQANSVDIRFYIEILVGLLGFGIAVRTYEKRKGIASGLAKVITKEIDADLFIKKYKKTFTGVNKRQIGFIRKIIKEMNE